MRTQPTVFTVREAARALRIGESTAYAAIRDGDFPVPIIRIGGRYAVPAKPLLDLLGLDKLPADAA
ncbi:MULTISPECIES: helix-turn-helix transcriptional regulator [Corynebacterium]|uniref:helix-turn-helix transcriptional regulator n=1 Tax=Corynebacterium TaxID=1716 RepID=UPI001651CE71|nr:helix-turn-helix domain-containing protein [Corynebacterium sp. LK15]MBC6769301.1 DNA-binding protein [Corynebacterium sp. LK15]